MLNLCNNLFPFDRTKDFVIFKENEPNSHVYFIKSGEVAVYRKLEIADPEEQVHSKYEEKKLLKEGLKGRFGVNCGLNEERP